MEFVAIAVFVASFIGLIDLIVQGPPKGIWRRR